MLKNILYIMLLLPVLSYSQVEEVYWDENYNAITQEDFIKDVDPNKYIYSRFELDTLIVNKKSIKKIKGSVPKSLLDSIKNKLNKQGKKTILQNETLVIKYYTTLDGCYSYYKKNTSHRYFKRKIKRSKNTSLVYVLSIDNDFEGKVSNEWHADRNQLIEKTFFPIHFMCGSYVIIDSQGNYLARRSEYNPREILDHINPKNGKLWYIEETESSK